MRYLAPIDEKYITLEVNPECLFPYLEQTLAEKEGKRDEAFGRLEDMWDEYGFVGSRETFFGDNMMPAFGPTDGVGLTYIQTAFNTYLDHAREVGLIKSYIDYLRARPNEPVYIVPKATFFNNKMPQPETEEPRGESVFEMAERRQRELLNSIAVDSGDEA